MPIPSVNPKLVPGEKPTVKSLLKDAGLFVDYYITFLDKKITSLEEFAKLTPDSMKKLGVAKEHQADMFSAVGKANQYLNDL